MALAEVQEQHAVSKSATEPPAVAANTARAETLASTLSTAARAADRPTASEQQRLCLVRAADIPEYEEGTVLGDRYLIGEELGRSDTSIVYKAFDSWFENWPVALKVLPRQLAADQATCTALSEAAQAAFGLVDEHVIRLHEVERFADGNLCLVMQLLESSELRDCIANYERTCEYAQALTLALTAAHGEGVFHGALRPSCVMQSPANEGATVKLSDLGTGYWVDQFVARALGMTASGAGARQAPELGAAGVGLTGAADQYGLAAMVYELLVGQPLPVDRSLAALGDGHCPQSARAALARALSEDPAARYDDCLQFFEAFAGAPLSKKKSASAAGKASGGSARSEAEAGGDASGGGAEGATCFIDDDDEAFDADLPGVPTIANNLMLLGLVPLWLALVIYGGEQGTIAGLFILGWAGFWVFVDAGRRLAAIPAALRRERQLWSRWSWAAGTMLLFVLVYPSYVLSRGSLQRMATAARQESTNDKA